MSFASYHDLANIWVKGIPKAAVVKSYFLPSVSYQSTELRVLQSEVHLPRLNISILNRLFTQQFNQLSAGRYNKFIFMSARAGMLMNSKARTNIEILMVYSSFCLSDGNMDVSNARLRLCFSFIGFERSVSLDYSLLWRFEIMNVIVKFRFNSNEQHLHILLLPLSCIISKISL